MKIFVIAALLATGTAALAAQASTEAQHHADMNRRGALVMGFDQENTVHHFFLYEDGGAIEVSVIDTTDTVNLDAIRGHLPHIVTMFAQGRFDAPMLVHSTDVPGTSDMTRLKNRLAYTFAPTARGGRVEIKTSDPAALAAVHRFLTFQITDHKTGDTTEVRKR